VRKKTTTAADIDAAFDRGDDMSTYFDFERGRMMPSVHVKKVNVDMPQNVVDALDEQAKHMGVTRQSLIKIWLWERLREEQERDGRLIPPREDGDRA
jgi:hypothetical protein